MIHDKYLLIKANCLILHVIQKVATNSFFAFDLYDALCDALYDALYDAE